MSIMIVLYQLFIFGIIVIASLVGGKIVSGITILGAILWTCTHVFWLPLMLIQFGTIIVASLIGFPLACLRDWLWQRSLQPQPIPQSNKPKNKPHNTQRKKIAKVKPFRRQNHLR